MSYSFKPLTEEELNSFKLLENGIYEFEVYKSTRKISSSGNPMAELQLFVWNDNNPSTSLIFDYLVFSNVNLNIRKVKHFCDAVGLHDQYIMGEIPEILEKYKGKLEIGTQEKQPRPIEKGGGFYNEKNIVIDYISMDKILSNIPVLDYKDNLNDDVPF